MTPARIAFAAVTAAVLSLALPTVALAQAPPVAVGVAIYVATMDKGKIDKSIKNLPALKKPPFSQFRTWKLLSTTRLTLAKDVAQSVAPPNGTALAITYKGPMPPLKPGDPILLGFGALLKKADGTSQPSQTLRVKPGDTMILSSGNLQMGVIMVAVKVAKK